MLTKQTFLTQTGPGIKRPVLHFQGKNQLESQSAGDLNAKKQRSAGKIRDIKEITKSLSDGSSVNPTGEQKSTTGSNCHKNQSAGEIEKPRDFCKGITSLSWETRAHCTIKNC
jgi:hypothetical protein